MKEKEKEILDKLFGAEFQERLDATEDLDVLIEELKSIERQRHYAIFENDVPDSVKNKIIQSFEGKFNGTLDTNLKKQGLSPDEIKGKSIAEKLALLAEKYDEKIKTASTKGVAEIQEELMNLNKKIDEYDNVLIPSIKENAYKESVNFKINNILTAEYGNIDSAILSIGKEGRETAFKMIDFYLRDNYDVRLENNKVEFFQKGTDTKVMNQSKSEILPINKVILAAIQTIGLLRQSNGSGTPITPINTDTNNKITGQSNEKLLSRLA